MRFSGRANVYARFRPGYPDEVIRFLAKRAGWRPDSAIADIGAGTGISSELFLRHGNSVWAVEPNADMRAEAEHWRTQYPRFQITDGVAEKTGLPSASFDFVVAATAFHWFDAAVCRQEFRRLLRPEGKVVLIWNLYQSPEAPLVREFEEIAARYGHRGRHVWGRERYNIGNAAVRLFGDSYRRRYLENTERLNLESFEGRSLSASYAPLPGDPRFEPMLAELRALFAKYAVDGQVELKYQTALYYGELG